MVRIYKKDQLISSIYELHSNDINVGPWTVKYQRETETFQVRYYDSFTKKAKFFELPIREMIPQIRIISLSPAPPHISKFKWWG